MQIGEMHNHLRLELNKINSNLYDDFLPEEIDAFLNQQMFSFIKQRYNPTSNIKKRGFEETQKRIDDLRKCLVTDYELRLYRKNDDVVYTPLPSDYMFHTSSKSYIYYNSCDRPITTTLLTESSYLAFIPMSTNSITTYEHFDITSNGNSILNTTDFEKYIFPEHRDDFAARVCSSLSPSYKSMYELHYGTYLGETYPNMIIVVKKSNTAPTIVYKFRDGYTNTTTWNYYSNLYYIGNTGGTYKNVLCRIITQDEIEIDNPFQKSTYDTDGMLIDFSENNINVNLVPNIMATKLYLSYIRKPKKMNLALSQDCELSEHTHLEILAMTVNHVLEVMESRRYSTNQNELNKTE